jgi:hypothetical protein
MKYDGNGNFISNFKTHTKYVTNDDFNKDNYEFPDLEIPMSGTFAISVTAEGAGCFRCCFSNCQLGYSRPRLKGYSAFYNASSSPGYYLVPPNKTMSCF